MGWGDPRTSRSLCFRVKVGMGKKLWHRYETLTLPDLLLIGSKNGLSPQGFSF